MRSMAKVGKHSMPIKSKPGHSCEYHCDSCLLACLGGPFAYLTTSIALFGVCVVMTLPSGRSSLRPLGFRPTLDATLSQATVKGREGSALANGVRQNSDSSPGPAALLSLPPRLNAGPTAVG